MKSLLPFQPNARLGLTRICLACATLVSAAASEVSRIWKAPYNLAREFHGYGFEWNPEVLRYTVDGTVVREERNTHWHQPLALCFDSETFAGWFGLPKDDALPATFSIDYIRTWKRNSESLSGTETSSRPSCWRSSRN